MISMKVSGDNIAAIVGRIRIELLQDASSLLDEVAEKVVFPSIEKNFIEEGRPDKWDGLSERTQRERMDEGYNPEHPILVRSGDLKRGAIREKYADIDYVLEKHRLTLNYLSTKGIKLHNGEWNLPARPFFGLQREDAKLAETVLRKHIQKEIQRIIQTEGATNIEKMLAA